VRRWQFRCSEARAQDLYPSVQIAQQTINCVTDFSRYHHQYVVNFPSLRDDCRRRLTRVAHPGDGRHQREILQLDLLSYRLDFINSTLALAPIIFSRNAGFQYCYLGGERRDFASEGIASVACSTEIAPEAVYRVLLSEHLLLRMVRKILEQAEID
jgi:hypothetical protein